MVTRPSTPRIARISTSEVISGIGWSRGMADQLSLPNISAPSPGGDFAARSTGNLRSGTWRERLRGDGAEQPRVHAAIGEVRHLAALLRKAGVGRLVERRAGAADAVRPGGELGRRHAVHLELHVREPVAAE